MEEKTSQYRPSITLSNGTRITPKLVPDGKGGYDLTPLMKEIVANQAKNRGKRDEPTPPPESTHYADG